MAIIARATVNDAAEIARVYVDTWRSAYAGILADKMLLSMSADRQAAEWAWMIRNRGDSQPVLVASEAKHGAVGFISVGASRAGARPLGGPFASTQLGEVYTLYVLPAFQELGIGRQLLAAGFAALAEKGRSGALVWVLRDNPACFFYERMGGFRVAERRERLWGRDVPEVAYGWPDLKLAVSRIGSCSPS